MRLFVAVEVPGRVEAALSRVREAADPDLVHARWVPSGNIHLTLRFLGEVSPARLDSVEEALALIRSSRLALEVAGVGFFPSARAPLVLWAGVRGGGLASLADHVDRAVATSGIPRQGPGFQPHLTLARAPRKGTIGRAVVEAATRFDRELFASFTADRFVLFRSRTHPDGARYTAVAEFGLDAENR